MQQVLKIHYISVVSKYINDFSVFSYMYLRLRTQTQVFKWPNDGRKGCTEADSDLHNCKSMREAN